MCGFVGIFPAGEIIGVAVKIVLGHVQSSLLSGRKEPVVFDTQKLVNAHTMIIGKSGVGKTHTLKKMLSQMTEQAHLRIHVMDVHGDIDIAGASSVRFSEATPYGFNPLMINPDPDFGGVRKRIQSFIATLNRTSMKLGPKQEAALRNLLVDLYAANGFYENDANSWKINDGVKRQYPKKMPTMEDAVKFARAKLKMMFLGTSSESVQALEALYRKQGQYYRAAKKLRATESASPDATKLEIMKKELSAMAEDSTTLFREHLDAVATGHELDDLLKYDSKDVMKSVVDRLENLHSSGIFRSQRPPFDNSASIWRYDIKALSPPEKKMFVSFLLEAIFYHATQRGVKSDVVELVVLDEAHLFLTDDEDNPINIIAKEARKFGLGLFCASQSPLHFSDDFLSNVSTKIILGIDQMFWDGSARKLKVDIKALEWIVSQKKILIQLNNRGESRNEFIYTALNADAG